MKHLFTLTMALAMTSSFCQAAGDEKDTTSFTLHYDAILTDPYQEHLRIEVYEFDQENCNWNAIMMFDSQDSCLQLERSKGYQIWMSEENESKVFCIQPGYTGDDYQLHANFTLELCVLMIPNGRSYQVEYVEFDILIPYIYQSEILN